MKSNVPSCSGVWLISVQASDACKKMAAALTEDIQEQICHCQFLVPTLRPGKKGQLLRKEELLWHHSGVHYVFAYYCILLAYYLHTTAYTEVITGSG